MALQLSALVALVEDPDSITSTHTVTHKHLLTQLQGYLMPSSSPHEQQVLMQCINIHAYRHIPANNNNNKTHPYANDKN